MVARPGPRTVIFAFLDIQAGKKIKIGGVARPATRGCRSHRRCLGTDAHCYTPPGSIPVQEEI